MQEFDNQRGEGLIFSSILEYVYINLVHGRLKKTTTWIFTLGFKPPMCVATSYVYPTLITCHCLIQLTVEQTCKLLILQLHSLKLVMEDLK